MFVGQENPIIFSPLATPFGGAMSPPTHSDLEIQGSLIENYVFISYSRILYFC